MKINSNFDRLEQTYLFAEINRRTAEFSKKNPGVGLIKLGIGDVTLPLAPAVVDALVRGSRELGVKESFRGYPPYEGYAFVREAVSGYYESFGVKISPDEIFINDGAKSDCANIGDIFSSDNTVLVTDPVYPVYVDSNIMAGRKIIYAKATRENGFCAMPDRKLHADLIYLCSPNNPTGSAYSYEQLREWTDYANEHDALIIYDAAYEAFITDSSPRSIFAVPGASSCAIELCSLSKTAGFTGTRAGYTVIPRELSRDGRSIYELWYRRQSTKYNGLSWPVQCAAAAVFSPEGLVQIRENLSFYRENALAVRSVFEKAGLYCTGGVNSPYVWAQCPFGLSSWDFFDLLLNEAKVIGTPGEGFGECGRGYFRFSGFGSREDTFEAVKRLGKLLSDGI